MYVILPVYSVGMLVFIDTTMCYKSTKIKINKLVSIEYTAMGFIEVWEYDRLLRERLFFF
jgi:hypothetical protein